MIEDMPRRLPYLQRERTRHGRVAWYVRLDRGARIRIRGEYGSPEFVEVVPGRACWRTYETAW